MPCARSHDTSASRPSGQLANDASCPDRIAASILSLATSMPTSLLFCAILRFPSLLVRAPGPCNCSGLRKTPRLSHAPLQALALGTYGLRCGDGRWLEQPPVRTLCTNRLHKG